MPLPRPCVRGASSLAAPGQTAWSEPRRTSKALSRVRSLPRRLRAAGAAPKGAYEWSVRSPSPRGGQRGRVARAVSLPPCAHGPPGGPAPGEAAVRKAIRARRAGSRHAPRRREAGQRPPDGPQPSRAGHAGEAYRWARVWAPLCARVGDQHAGVRWCGALGRRGRTTTAGRTPTGHGHKERRGTHRPPRRVEPDHPPCTGDRSGPA